MNKTCGRDRIGKYFFIASGDGLAIKNNKYSSTIVISLRCHNRTSGHRGCLLFLDVLRTTKDVAMTKSS